MLWIGLHLPLLSLESFAATLPPGASSDAIALLDAHVIASANAHAQQLGVKPGLKRSTALALASQLRLGQADPARDAQALTSVAHAALAFTPAVTLPPQDTQGLHQHHVLMEVQMSLRYFGGLDQLLQRLSTTLAPLGHRVCVASAPTAQGAALLARCVSLQASKPLHCADLDALRHRLDSAPVWLLGPGREHWEALQGMGLRTLSDLRRLPRSGLARRFGEALLDEIDRAFGDRPDPRIWVTLPPAFESRLELFARADTTAQVLYGASVLLARLVTWAQAQHARVRRFTLVMQHEPRHQAQEAPAQTLLDIALAEPSRDAAHLGVLLRERLAYTQLAAPTLELHLRCHDIARSAPPNNELFPTQKSEREGLVRLIERLQARLGAEQVQRLALVQDHRPEQACMAEPAAAAGAALAQRVPRAASALAHMGTPAPGSRPVWLLREPQPLPERRHLPWLDGAPLQLLSGPERIESGWWDGALAERDYFIAQGADGALVWVFRGRLPLSTAGQQGWFLQGRFG
jgi:protein ImuB